MPNIMYKIMLLILYSTTRKSFVIFTCRYFKKESCMKIPLFYANQIANFSFRSIMGSNTANDVNT